MLDNWDLVRAVEHLIEVHGSTVARVAHERAARSSQIEQEMRWRTIAETVKELQASKNGP
jgi:hypothetical protein